MPSNDLTSQRPNVFVFEWLIGGGQLHDARQLLDNQSTLQRHNADSIAIDNTMAREGLAMLAAVCQDFQATGCKVQTTLDCRIDPPELSSCRCDSIRTADDLWDSLSRNADDADLVLVIAPETDNRLVKLLQFLSPFQPKLLNPGLGFTTIASDKTDTCRQLKSFGIRVPNGWKIETDRLSSDSSHLSDWSLSPEWPHTVDQSFPEFPVVLKPNHGAGSEGNLRLDDQDEFHRQLGHLALSSKSSSNSLTNRWRVESWACGTAASISVIANSMEPPTILPPFYQHLENQVSRWLGAEPITDTELIARATHVARRVHDAMPKTVGYYGIDLVLGQNREEDTVIEVNPRLTSSYSMIRNRIEFNMATRMIEANSKGR